MMEAHLQTNEGVDGVSTLSWYTCANRIIILSITNLSVIIIIIYIHTYIHTRFVLA
jgi:hypothetical protein